MIFLGAGASAPFGPKPYSKIEEEVWNILREYDVEEMCWTAQAQINNDKIIFDFEAILTIFEFLKDTQKGIIEGGPLLSWLRREKLADEFKCTPKTAEDVIKRLKELLYRNCLSVDMKKANAVYDTFFDILKESKEVGMGIDHDIFTTNYDMIIEKYHWNRTRKIQLPRLKTGFESNRNPHFLEFQPSKSYGELDPDLSVGNVRRLFKLHGSIDQKIENNVVYKCHPEIRHDIQFAKDMMVFPVAEKYITQYPYFTLYHYLQGVAWTVGSQKEACIVVGFSFRDIPIVNAFLKHIIRNEKEGKESSIILIDKDTSSVMENLQTFLSGEDFQKIHEVIKPISEEFGSDAAFRKLDNMLGAQYYMIEDFLEAHKEGS